MGSLVRDWCEMWSRSGPERRSPRRAAGVVAAFVVALALVVGLGAGPASAHATLLSTSPADDELLEEAPDQVELTFDEAVEVAEDGVEVIGPSGDRVDDGEIELAEDDTVLRVALTGDERGTYTVAWRILSEDSHNISGSFIFHVGERTGAAELDDGDDTLADLAGGVGRFAGFAGAMAIVGAVFVTLVCCGDEAVERRTRRLAIAAGVAGVVGVALVLVSQTADTTGRSLLDAVGKTWDTTWDTRTGRLTAWRGVALAGALVVAAVRPLWRRIPWLALGAAAAAVVLQSLSGHAWTADERGVAVVSDVIHLSAVAVWVGGLVALVLALPVADDRGHLARRFSAVALGAVVAVAVTGTVSGVIEVGSLSALVDTGYGQLLLVKVAGFLVLVGLGWLNRTQLIPAVEKMSAMTARPAMSRSSALVTSVRAEVAVAAVVLVVTALLVNQPPARDSDGDGAASAGQFDDTVAAAGGADAALQIQVTPGEVGSNDVHLWFYESDGATPLAVDAAQMTAATGSIPPRRLDLVPATPSHMSAVGATFGSAGTWTLEVIATSAGTPLTFTFEVSIS
jgi:copper transport protein